MVNALVDVQLHIYFDFFMGKNIFPCRETSSPTPFAGGWFPITNYKQIYSSPLQEQIPDHFHGGKRPEDNL